MTTEIKIFRTWENHCLKTLKEKGKSTLKEWAEAMNTYASSMATVVRNNLDKLIITPTKYKTRKYYEVKEEVSIV